MLRIRDLTIHYGRVAAVQDVSLDVNEGEIVGLVGPNGAGKSTTLSAVMGLIRPTRGAIEFEDVSLIGQAPERIVRHGVALVPEGRHIFATLTVAENLQLGMTPISNGVGTDALAHIFELFPSLKSYYRGSAATLSGGEQQQLAIARALLSRPRLLLLDEPSLGLAPQIVDLVFEVMEELRREGVTVLLVEQNATRTIELADRTYVIRAGRIALEGRSKELLETVALEEAYLGM